MASLTSLLEQLHQAQQRLAELEAIEHHQAQLDQLADSLSQVTEALNNTVKEVNDTAGRIDQAREHLGDALDSLGNAHKGLKDFLARAGEAAGDVSKGLKSFAKHAKNVGDTLSQMDEAYQKVKELIDKAEGSPSEIVDAFGEYLKGIAEGLSHLIGRIPGLGAFMTIWLMAIEDIQGNIKILEGVVAERNAMMRQLFGKDLYITPRTPGQRRADEIKELEDAIDELIDQIANHPEYGGQLDPPAPGETEAERQARDAHTDMRAAVQNLERQPEVGKGGLREAETELVGARQRVRDTWSRLRALENQREMLLVEIRAAERQVTVAEGALATARVNKPYVQDQLDRARNRRDGLVRRREELEARIEQAVAELRHAWAAYAAALAVVEQHYQYIRDTLDRFRPANRSFFEEHYPRYYQSDYWDIWDWSTRRARNQTDAIKDRLGEPEPGDRSAAGAQPISRSVLIGAAALLVVGLAVTAAVSLTGDPGGMTMIDPPDLIINGGGDQTSGGLDDLDELKLAAYWVLHDLGVPPEVIREWLAGAREDEINFFMYSISTVMPGNPGPDVDITHYLRGRLPVDQETADDLFNFSRFPCGSFSDGRRVVCAADAQPMPAGDLLIAVTILAEAPPEPVRQTPAGTTPQAQSGEYWYIYAAIFDSDGDSNTNWVPHPDFDWDFYQGADRWYELTGLPAAGHWQLAVRQYDGQQLTIEATAARVVLEGNAVVFVMPAAEVPVDAPYRVTAFRHDGHYTVEHSAGDVSGQNPTQPLELQILEPH